MLIAASTKPDVIPNSGSRRGIPAWRKGLVLRLSPEHEDQWCIGCWITILVDVTYPGIYMVQARTNFGERELFRYQVLDDVAFYQDKQICYRYHVEKEDKDIQIQVALFSGLVSFSANPRTIPTDYTTSKFKSVDQKS